MQAIGDGPKITTYGKSGNVRRVSIPGINDEQYLEPSNTQP